MFASLLTVCDHPVTGPEELAGVPWRFGETPARVRSNAPLVGQHTAEVIDGLGQRVVTSAAPPAGAVATA